MCHEYLDDVKGSLEEQGFPWPQPDGAIGRQAHGFVAQEHRSSYPHTYEIVSTYPMHALHRMVGVARRALVLKHSKTGMAFCCREGYRSLID